MANQLVGLGGREGIDSIRRVSEAERVCCSSDAAGDICERLRERARA